MTVAQYREAIRPQAEQRAKVRLVLLTLAQVEQITVSPEEIEAQAEKIVSGAERAGEADSIREMLDTAQGRELIEEDLRGEKTLARLRDIVTGQPVPPLDNEDNQPDSVPDVQGSEEAADSLAGETDTEEPAAAVAQTSGEVQGEGEPGAEERSET
jgi:hypothetical protein